MVEEVRERRGNAVVILGRDDDDAIGSADRPGQPFEDLGGLAFGVLLVHPVDQRQVQLHRVDQRDGVASGLERPDEVAGEADPSAVAADRAEDDEKVERHGG
jgi:hypothetical protein